MPPPQDFASLEQYTPVKPLEVLARELGVRLEDLAKLDANENLYGPLPEVRLFFQRRSLAVVFPIVPEGALVASLMVSRS